MLTHPSFTVSNRGTVEASPERLVTLESRQQRLDSADTAAFPLVHLAVEDSQGLDTGPGASLLEHDVDAPLQPKCAYGYTAHAAPATGLADSETVHKDKAGLSDAGSAQVEEPVQAGNRDSQRMVILDKRRPGQPMAKLSSSEVTEVDRSAT